jgi:hypothetical protein
VSPVKCELGFYITKDILYNHRLENLKFYRVNMSLLAERSRYRERLCAEPPKVGSLNFVKDRFSHFHVEQAGAVAHPASYSLGTACSFLGG